MSVTTTKRCVQSVDIHVSENADTRRSHDSLESTATKSSIRGAVISDLRITDAEQDIRSIPYARLLMKTETEMTLISMKRKFYAKNAEMIARSIYKDHVICYNLTMSEALHIKSFAVTDAKRTTR